MKTMATTKKLELVIVFLRDAYFGSARLLRELRENEVLFVYDASDRSIAQKLEFARSQGAHYVMFVDDKEIDEALYSIQDLRTGKVSKHSIERIVSIIKDYRK